MKTQTLLKTVSQIGLVNNYKKGLYFTIGVIVVGGVLVYAYYTKYEKLERRVANLERSQAQLTERVEKNTSATKNLDFNVQSMLENQKEIFTILKTLDGIVKASKDNA
jgi:hypothetical protein